MFAIALKADRYPTYVLSDSETGARLEIVPERGGIVTRWQVQDQDILYFDEERFANPELSVRGGIPILFPICGNLPDNAYTLNGQPYTLKQHGFARDLPWQVVLQDVREAAALTLQLTSDDQTRSVYPFDFRLQFTYRLHGHILDIQQQVTNLSDQPMPFSTGLHPYFWVKDKSQLSFELPAQQYQNHITGELEPFPGSFDLNQPEIDVALRPLSGTAATVTDTDLNRRLTLNWSDAYSTLVFWAVKGKDYYCLEPWSAPRNALNTSQELLTLAPQTTCETNVRLAVAFL
ncbi:MAG: aldose epimerase [Cyanobacteria bacterium Co-bin8]|nr:aldose epimerase [Cyanobacteria bacterium Co-bin8]